MSCAAAVACPAYSEAFQSHDTPPGAIENQRQPKESIRASRWGRGNEEKNMSEPSGEYVEAHYVGMEIIWGEGYMSPGGDG
jgi:hypothetical protein